MSQATSWLIVNPTAGRRRGERLVEEIKTYLDHHDFPVSIHAPEGEDNLTSTGRQALDAGVDNLILVGGDGTFNLGINCLMHALCEAADCQSADNFPNLPLNIGFIPAGTGNDFIKATNIPNHWREACDVILAGNTHTIDIGRARVLQRDHDRSTNEIHADSLSTPGEWIYFLNHIASGLDAQVGITANHLPILRGSSVYVAALIYHLIKGYAGHQATLTFPGSDAPPHTAQLGLCATANGISYGGTFHIAPDAQLNDGLFTIVLAEWRGRWATLKALLALLKGQHYDNPIITTWQGRAVRVDTDTPIPLVADGELVEEACRSYMVELLSHPLTIFDQVQH